MRVITLYKGWLEKFFLSFRLPNKVYVDAILCVIVDCIILSTPRANVL
jgi:hypothetical protein